MFIAGEYSELWEHDSTIESSAVNMLRCIKIIYVIGYILIHKINLSYQVNYSSLYYSSNDRPRGGKKIYLSI